MTWNQKTKISPPFFLSYTANKSSSLEVDRNHNHVLLLCVPHNILKTLVL